MRDPLAVHGKGYRMRMHILSVVAAACLPFPAVAQTASSICITGPIIKTFGGSKWVVNSCADDRTLTLMAMKESPASPCFIVIAPAPDGYSIDGRGKGDKQATQAAMDELGALSVEDIRALIAETKQKK